MADVTTTSTTSQRIGCLLRELRKQRRITGQELAPLAGISQSRISKIENGYSSKIDVEQIENLLDILKPSKIIRQQIAMLLFQSASGSGVQYTYPFMDMPYTLDELQKMTKVFRCYIVCGISAVLQTAEYRAAYLKRLGLSEQEAQQELGRNIERQDALWDVSKTFHLVMPEAALYTMPADCRVQIAQLDRLERIVGSKNVHIGIIPMQAGVSVFETGSFTLYDEEVLYVFMGDHVVRVTEAESLVKYLSAFDEMIQMSCFDADAIELIRKAERYFSE